MKKTLRDEVDIFQSMLYNTRQGVTMEITIKTTCNAETCGECVCQVNDHCAVFNNTALAYSTDGKARRCSNCILSFGIEPREEFVNESNT
jgi:hypothetical protein